MLSVRGVGKNSGRWALKSGPVGWSRAWDRGVRYSGGLFCLKEHFRGLLAGRVPYSGEGVLSKVRGKVLC